VAKDDDGEPCDATQNEVVVKKRKGKTHENYCGYFANNERMLFEHVKDDFDLINEDFLNIAKEKLLLNPAKRKNVKISLLVRFWLRFFLTEFLMVCYSIFFFFFF
jgi:hypothetical protein